MKIRNYSENEAQHTDDLNDKLFDAVHAKDLVLVEELITKRANANAVGMSLNTPLHIAAYDNLKMAKLLLKLGANPNAVNGEGNTPLHIASRGGNSHKLQIVYLLVEKGSDVNLPNYTGETPLHVCAKNSQHDYSDDSFSPNYIVNHDIAKFLLGRGAKKDVTNIYGRTPAQSTRESGMAAILKTPTVSKENILAMSNENEVLRSELNQLRREFDSLSIRLMPLPSLHIQSEMTPVPVVSSLNIFGVLATQPVRRSNSEPKDIFVSDASPGIKFVQHRGEGV